MLYFLNLSRPTASVHCETPRVSSQHCESRHLHLCVTCRAHLDPWSYLKKLWTTSKSPLFTCFGEVSQKSHVLFVNTGSRGFLRRLLLKSLKDYGRSSLPSVNIAYASYEAYNSLVDDDDWDVRLGISWELLERESRRFNGYGVPVQLYKAQYFCVWFEFNKRCVNSYSPVILCLTVIMKIAVSGWYKSTTVESFNRSF